MKKLLLLSLLFSKTILLSQTVLNTFPLNLNNLGQTQILNVEDEKTNDIYAFAWDNKNITILKYNKSVFLTNQFTDSIKYEKDRNLLGYTINQENKPMLFWISKNSKNILINKYDLDTKTSKSLNFNFPGNHEYIITSFQQHDAFYILAKEKDFEHLLLYKFKDGNCEIKMLDFSTFVFKNDRNVNFSFNALIKYFPITKMESDILNPIDLASKISKLYVLDDSMILTFDNSLIKTQAFDIDMKSGIIKEKTFNLPDSQKESRTSNSFYNDKKLFQMFASKEELLFEVKDFDSGNTIKKYSISKNDSIPFKTSPFFVQIDNRRPQQINNTAKFLKHLDGLPAGISVLKNKKSNFITFSGYGEYSDFYYQPDSFGDFGERVPYSISKMVYFDAVFDEKFDLTKDKKQEPFAIDNLFYFLNINKKISLFTTLKLKDYYILSYYDSATKQFIMRKFTDGFMMEDNGNPIMNKALFSNPASFGSIKSQ
ncbi:hypothetical protein K6T82_12795 [Flavobacterium sp. 17A]|uniref:6-bladed beta-propeller protein n=1 Tax=Flavobacterium potami TaxID=2872310 RepID=A0A9X1HAR8_9FLAO|nr:hypothetical protein [Flavobacterium potami]MBZ4035651.1 hypothetical protein [Flavobacterium potami]